MGKASPRTKCSPTSHVEKVAHMQLSPKRSRRLLLRSRVDGGVVQTRCAPMLYLLDLRHPAPPATLARISTRTAGKVPSQVRWRTASRHIESA